MSRLCLKMRPERGPACPGLARPEKELADIESHTPVPGRVGVGQSHGPRLFRETRKEPVVDGRTE